MAEQPTTEQPYTEADVARIRRLIAMPSEVVPRAWDREPYPQWAARAILADLAAAGRLRPEGTEIVHLCPVGDSAVTPCCGRSPFELPRIHRLTIMETLVTCPGERR